MFCPSCGVKNEGSPLKCFICGYILPSGDRAATREARRTRATSNSSAEPYAAIGDRMLALILDRLLILAVLAIPAAAMAGRWSRLDSRITAPVRATILGTAALLVAILAYHIVLEALFGATLGKGLLGLQVRNGTGERSWLAASIRNVARLLDAIAFYALAFIVAIFSSRRQRIGDYLAGTTVIEQRVVWGARLALIFIWLAIVAGSLWLAAFLCPSCAPSGSVFKLTLR